ncbi:bile acid:sodium symporter family protein [Tsuneonella amylolytica]|uniref:bile acid:sodium symporter family protein n=1 Tax=Tsuneonella amylolytica TaxID=2338327 RepID=UPI000EAA47C5|nr:bile acid:sodium symporter family protein [Tsuneonella amylolytica]
MKLLSRIDPMVRLLVVAIALASIVPATGAARPVVQGVSNAAIFLLFLLNGLRLPRAEVKRGIGHVRFLLPLALWCFGGMALAGKGLSVALEGSLPYLVALGFLYLGVLPSTVQSATAYSSLAGGNVASSVVAAALLNVAGVFATAPLFAALGGGAAVSMGAGGLAKVFAMLILPFAIGQVLQVRLADWTARHKSLVTWMDRISIAIAVYVAMSGAVEQGLWTRVSPLDWAILLGGVIVFLAAGFAGAWLLSGAARLERPDRIAFLFAGGHKSIAMGAPLAAILFPPAVAGMVLLPLLAYHLLQLVASAPLANRLAARSQMSQAPDSPG